MRLQTLRLLSLSLLTLLVLFAGPVLAQEPDSIPIQYGAVLEGTISNENYFVTYRFEGTAGDVVTVELIATSGDLDPFVGLFDPSQDLVAQNDDIDRAANNFNSRIEGYTLLETGTYLIGATRFNVADGTSTGDYTIALTLASGSDQQPGPPTTDATTEGATSGTSAAPPDLSVEYQEANYGDTLTGDVDEANPPQYYLFYGRRGDLLSAILTTPGTAFSPVLRFVDDALNEVSRGFLSDQNDTRAYFAIPETGWFLLEVGSQSGSGQYSIVFNGFGSQLVEYGASLTGQVTSNASTIWYTFAAHHGDRVNIQMTATSGDLAPNLILGDVYLNDLASSSVNSTVATLNYTVPRAGTYVILASRDGLAQGTTTGTFAMTLEATPLNLGQIAVASLGYGMTSQGTISNEAPVAYYSFQGKSGDLVTIGMDADDPLQLDPLLILHDADLNELTFSDNTGTSNSARIFQYTLPNNGQYFIVATRPDLYLGSGAGGFSISLTVGEVELTSGAVEATLRWNNTGDVDLFVTDPNGETVAWDRREVASGGVLEVDTNSNCESLTPLPVEHVYWPEGTNLPGIYRIAVLYQLDCDGRGPTLFDLSVVVGGQEIVTVSDTLERGQRYIMSITVNPDGRAFSNNDGIIDVIQTEQTPSETLTYGQSVTGTISATSSFVVYEFDGQAGDQVLITMDRVSGDLDPLVGLFDPDGQVIAQDDDGGGDRNARLQFTLPTTGRYQVAATRYGTNDGTSTGDYQLTLSKLN